MDHWTNFFQSAVGAAATLCGMLVVAISINLNRILANPRLPGRAAEALVPLTGVLVISMLALIPLQPAWLFGVESFGAGVLMGAWRLFARGEPAGEPSPISTRLRLTHLVLRLAQSLPFVAAGLLMVLNVSGGLYWIVPGVIFSLVAGILNTWVLLIEILR